MYDVIHYALISVEVVAKGDAECLLPLYSSLEDVSCGCQDYKIKPWPFLASSRCTYQPVVENLLIQSRVSADKVELWPTSEKKILYLRTRHHFLRIRKVGMRVFGLVITCKHVHSPISTLSGTMLWWCCTTNCLHRLQAFHSHKSQPPARFFCLNHTEHWSPWTPPGACHSFSGRDVWRVFIVLLQTEELKCFQTQCAPKDKMCRVLQTKASTERLSTLVHANEQAWSFTLAWSSGASLNPERSWMVMKFWEWEWFLPAQCLNRKIW